MESISDFFKGTKVLVTGGTGFLGKVLLEKLLRSCSGVDTIYVLMRPKRGMTVEQRYKQLLKNQVFDRIRSTCPERLTKLSPITGDVSDPGLGISDSELTLVSEVNVLFHSAATVKFTEALHVATKLNVQGTASVLKLARNMPHLKAFVYVSTAYSNAPRILIEERVYQPLQDPEDIINCTNAMMQLTNLAPKCIEAITEGLQGEHPNTYTLTKCLAEAIVYSHTELPVCIIRPSIVTAAKEEPFPGWIDNVYGITGIVMEISRGTFRSTFCRERYTIDLIPVDLVVNSCILAAWRQGTDNTEHCPVYNVTSGSINPLKWAKLSEFCLKWSRDKPTRHIMWYPNFAFTESRLLNVFWEITCHFLPAFLCDLLLRVQGRKAIMVKLAYRFKMAAATGEYFACHEWQFEVKQFKILHDKASLTNDAENFKIWPGQLKWDEYIGAYLMGIRKFILKDDVESLPDARKKLRRLYWLHRFLQTTFSYYLYRCFMRQFQ